ncbi:MAG TPA: hypothetical protein VKF62_11860, partial [Planctomycetota bacterium]|nr:hypothetical protein [Planctomycetota bacterium]
DDSVVVLPQTTVQIRVDGREAGAVALLAPEGEVLLGVEALKSLGLAVDPKGRRLVPSRPWAVRLGGYRGKRGR